MVTEGIHLGALGDIVWGVPTYKKLGITKLYINSFAISPESSNFISPLLNKCGFETEYLIEYSPKDVELRKYVHWLNEWWRGYDEKCKVNDHPMILQAMEFNQSVNLLEKFIFVTEGWNEQYDVVINKTDRYGNDFFDVYDSVKLLKNRHSLKIGFIGLENEYNFFKDKSKLNIDHIIVNDCVDICKVLNSTKLLICNNSLVHTIAEGMKTVPILHQVWNNSERRNTDIYGYGKNSFSIRTKDDLRFLKFFIDCHNLGDIL